MSFPGGKPVKRFPPEWRLINICEPASSPSKQKGYESKPFSSSPQKEWLKVTANKLVFLFSYVSSVKTPRVLKYVGGIGLYFPGLGKIYPFYICQTILVEIQKGRLSNTHAYVTILPSFQEEFTYQMLLIGRVKKEDVQLEQCKQ